MGGEHIPVCPEGETTPIPCLRWVWKVRPLPHRTEHLIKEDFSQALRFNVVCLLGFWTYLEPVTPSFSPISPFWNEMSILYLSHHCILEAHNLFDFTESQLGGIFLE